MPAASPSKYSVPALEKGLDILELLADATQPLSQVQIAERLDRSVNEIFRMLTRLEGRGYLHRGDEGHYRLSAKLFALSHRHPPTAHLLDAALPLMRQLAHDVGQSCHLATLHGQDILILVDLLQGPGGRLGDALDIDPPPGQLRCQARVLSRTSDGQ